MSGMPIGARERVASTTRSMSALDGAARLATHTFRTIIQVGPELLEAGRRDVERRLETMAAYCETPAEVRTLSDGSTRVRTRLRPGLRGLLEDLDREYDRRVEDALINGTGGHQ